MISVAIPTFGREQVLVETIKALLLLNPPPSELIVVDQTHQHDEETDKQLAAWAEDEQISLVRLPRPSIIVAMNTALSFAKGDHILFVDDDIIPSTNLLKVYEEVIHAHPDALIAGRVLQPWHHGEPEPEDKTPFMYNTLMPRACTEFIGCNFLLPRRAALHLGGFDAAFVRVAYRYEAEFAYRWRQYGHAILYEPRALIHHLRAQRGGTRSYGLHLTTIRPDHAVGRYYYLLRTGNLFAALYASIQNIFKSILTRHHFQRPWWIPFTLVAEVRGFFWALGLNARGPLLLSDPPPKLLIGGSHPIQYHTPLFQILANDPDLFSEVLYISLPSSETQGLGFGVSFTWDIPLLDGYSWRQAKSGRGKGITYGYGGVWLRYPLQELFIGPLKVKPDALFLTGWHFLGLVQLFIAATLLRIPVLLRMDSNELRPRSRPLAAIYWFLFRGVSVGLTVGKANERFYLRNGIPADRLVPSPHYVDNKYFSDRADAKRADRAELRKAWNVPENAFCFLFAGKLQDKKRPLDVLAALRLLQISTISMPHPIHLLMVGTGHLEQECRQQARQFHLPVSFTGFLNQSEIPTAYAVSDCLVLPSDHGETWGLVVNEAMACGLPAIVSDLVGCAEDLVFNGSTGMVFPFGDINSFADCMASIARDPTLASKMGSTARDLVHSSFTIEKAAQGVKQALALIPHR